MRDKEPSIKNKYYLPRSLYRRILSVVRDYDRRYEERDIILYGSKKNDDGMPHGTDITNPTENSALKIMLIDDEINAVDNALKVIPVEYRLHIFDNVRYGKKYNDYDCPACRNTWSKWRVRFLYEVAKNLKLL